MLFRFNRHEAHARPLNSLATRHRIGVVVLVGLNIGPHIPGRHHSGVMPELGKLAGGIVKANKYRVFSASNLAERGDDS